MIWTLVLSYLRAHWRGIAGTVLALSLVLGWSLHERHVQSGKDAATIAALKVRIADDDTALTNYAKAASDWQATADANKAAATAQKAAGDAALAKVKQDAVKQAQTLSDALRRQKAAYAGDRCAGLALPEGVE